MDHILTASAVAFDPPLLGVGIAAKGLLPSIGAKASKVGAEYEGNKLRSSNKSSAESKLRRDASKEVRRLKPQPYPNSIIRSLEAIATNPETDFDPVFDHRNWVDEFESPHYYTGTESAIREVCREGFGRIDRNPHQDHRIRWIQSVVDGPSS